MRSYRIGKKRVTEAEFDAEVQRLYEGGMAVGDYSPERQTGTGIAGTLRRERTAIWRALKRVGAQNTPSELEAAKVERKWAKQSADQFVSEPIIAQWIDDMKTRRVGSWPTQVSAVKQICEAVEIFPDQLDLVYGKKWLAKNSEVSLEKLRTAKIAARGFFKMRGVTDYALTQAGFDAKHYNVGKWKHVLMTEEQIKIADAYLTFNARPESLFVFRFGIETCRTLEPIWGLEASQFYTIDNEGEKLYAVNIFRKKTEKAGKTYKTAYCTKETYDLALRLGLKNGGRVMNGFTPQSIYEDLRAAYREVGLTVSYFYDHPIHALRHCGAQRWLAKTKFNRAVTAVMGGWDSEKTLEDHYGGVPEDIIRGFASEL